MLGKAPDGRAFPLGACDPLWSLVASASAAVAAEAGEKQDQDDGFASVAVAAEQPAAASAAAAAAAARTAVPAPTPASVSEEQEQEDNPNPVVVSVVPGPIASTGISATTVCSCQITHFICLHRFIYALFYAYWPVNVSGEIPGKFSEDCKVAIDVGEKGGYNKNIWIFHGQMLPYLEKGLK